MCSGGVKLIPERIESKISGIIPNRFFVAGMDDNELGEKLVLVVEGNNVTKDEVMQKLKEVSVLDKFEVPKEVICVKKFRETENGKIIREIPE